MLRKTLLITDLIKKRRIRARTRWSAFTKDQIYETARKYKIVGTLGFNEVKVTTCFNNLLAVFEKHKFAPPLTPPPTTPLRRTENSTWMKVALSKLPIIIYPRWLQENEKALVGKILCEDRGYLVNVCWFCSSGMFVAVGMMVSCERVCQEPCSEAKRWRTVVRRNMLGQNCCPRASYHVSNMYIKFHQRKTGHVVTDVRNVGTKLVKLTNQASLSVNVFLLKNLCKLFSFPSAVILYVSTILHNLNERFPVNHCQDF